MKNTLSSPMWGPQAAGKESEDLFIRNPDLYRINWFRNEEWKKGQEAKGGNV